MKTKITLAICLLMVLTSCNQLKKNYEAERAAEIKQYGNALSGLITEEDIAHLPAPVQRYFRVCGFIGREKMSNAQTTWKNVYLKRDVGAKWMPISCYQFNSVAEPMRIAYMKGRIFGLLSMEGRDIYQHGQGNMLIKLSGFLKVADAKGLAMDESSLVTLLAETFLVPTFALQPYITWQAIDENTAAATITHKGISVSGTFFFNKKGFMETFVSDDRNMIDDQGEAFKVRWTAYASNYYRQDDGTTIPGLFSAEWELESGPFEYFKGEIVQLAFDVK
jgi:hypothetical protein